ncbi:RidA family protein [Dyella sp. GSA-30]|uniref:RidA family protein n=1 Tax=Dyella sp. GSA-30 TaxID=2994496 RepID=UPI002493693C|nr:RidA family protein [Dyella sp. GSA-30]BDU21436.1 enamine deaminase RidA [Dyella sp. GSA-30]
MKRILVALSLLWTAAAVATNAPVQHINPPALSTPHGYSHVVVVRSGRTVYVAGQVPLDRNGALVGAGDLAAQARQVFENMKAALSAVGASYADVVDMTTYLTDVSQIDAYRKVRDQYMSAPLPAASLVEVKSLFRKDVMIEVSAVAVVQ